MLITKTDKKSYSGIRNVSIEWTRLVTVFIIPLAVLGWAEAGSDGFIWGSCIGAGIGVYLILVEYTHQFHATTRLGRISFFALIGVGSTGLLIIVWSVIVVTVNLLSLT